MESGEMARRLAQLSSADKQRLLTRLLREKALRHAAQCEGAGSTFAGDAALDPEIQPLAPASCPGALKAVLLTGATGFLGAHLLNELYRRTPATIYCLVRSQDSQDAWQ